MSKCHHPSLVSKQKLNTKALRFSVSAAVERTNGDFGGGQGRL